MANRGVLNVPVWQYKKRSGKIVYCVLKTDVPEGAVVWAACNTAIEFRWFDCVSDIPSRANGLGRRTLINFG